MKIRWIMLAALGIAMHPDDARAANADPCDSAAGMAAEAALELKEARLNAGAFVGTFEIENASKTSSISVGLVSESGGEFAFRPDFSIESLDLSGQWRRLIDLPGSYRTGPAMRVLPPGGKQQFKAILMTAETARLDAREFRLLLRTYNPRLCVRSVPFHGLPPKPPVQRPEPTRLVARPGVP
ncbi:hypothetical protein LYSHEL_26400 [Lysobacter helvus]|uniref:Uncharacterized protein n=2 Tax=Lysobacteraceae TaxID=32033 RepID=A0ABN6FXF9_9GAMM|nr:MULTISPECIES: hypothetical protein [Lysobacter]BCT93615.1 hypothetical protein LYSCAS_26390 [Lysobacter caseinilyticus]BCT96769.1 hypothetical protein LYSHEL_26400 [Lysobacter helvus]